MVVARVLAGQIQPLRVVAVLQALVLPFVLCCLEWWRVAAHELVSLDDCEIDAPWYFFSEAADSIFFAPLFQVGLAIFLPVALLGTGLPALIATATRRSVQLRATAGSLVFWNTLGSSAGGFAAGYLLIPALGLTGTFLALGLISLSLALGAEWKLKWERTSGRLPLLRRPGRILCGVSLLCSLLLLRGDITERTIRQFGFGARATNAELVKVVEGPLTTAYVFRSPQRLSVGAGNVCLAVANYARPSPQAIRGHLPVLFYPRPGAPERALGIALGSGQSFGALLRYDVRQVDVVDISSEMVDLSLEYFPDFNNRLGEDERVTFHVDDGRHFVDRAPDSSYDVVSMEPPHPRPKAFAASTRSSSTRASTASFAKGAS
jgi:spermidine synthase